MIDSFVHRLNKIGIQVKLIGNLPWIYLKEINGIKVTEKYYAEHGFTAFFYPIRKGQKIKFSNRKEVFKLIRKYCS